MLGSIAIARSGALLDAGAPVATIVPDGVLQVVAEYSPSAIGRLAAGLQAQIKLDGFPWTRWGTLQAHVKSVANEVRDGTIRVELTLAPQTRIPVAHGMTAIVDVEVEHVSPAMLVLRSLARRSASATP